jgi:hypothetical protein
MDRNARLKNAARGNYKCEDVNRRVRVLKNHY